MSNTIAANDTRLPVTLLTGFLGAGKTTLLNAIIAQPTGPRIAVIVNEFGEAGLDHDLIETVDEEVVLMKSGCLCCSIRGDLSRTLQDLAARKQESRLTFDRVVIETTGLADPAPILHTFLVDPYLAREFPHRWGCHGGGCSNRSETRLTVNSKPFRKSRWPICLS